MPVVSFATSTIIAGCLALCAACPAVAEDTILFDFAEPSSVHDWVPVKLPEPTRRHPRPDKRFAAGIKAQPVGRRLCRRDSYEASANCYYYAQGKHWKGVSGLYYGEDPDFWPGFIAHRPSGGGAVSTWEFTEAVKFWFDGQHANHGFFLYGDSNDYMRMYTPRVKDIKLRPAIMVVYDPKQ